MESTGESGVNGHYDIPLIVRFLAPPSSAVWGGLQVLVRSFLDNFFTVFE
jgi:hypothetical protein